MKVSSVLTRGIRGVSCFSARKVANAWNQASLTLVDARDEFGTVGAISSVRTRSERWLGSVRDLKTQERMATMSIEKKSLISNRAAIKKAMIASQPVETTEVSGDAKSLKATSLTAHSMKAKQAIRFFKKR